MKVRSRFSSFRDKLQVFFLGLLFGLVLGGGFFVLKLDQYVKELSFYKSLTQKEDKPEVREEEPKPDDQKIKPKKTKKNDAVALTDSSSATGRGDSVLPAVFDHDQPDDGIVIRKDEMLGQQTFAVKQISTSDSAAKETPAGSVSVEFWRSPLNYHGYKFTRSKLILFGFESGDIISLYKGDNNTYLKCTTGVYRLDVSSEFHALEPVADENIIGRMQ